MRRAGGQHVVAVPHRGPHDPTGLRLSAGDRERLDTLTGAGADRFLAGRAALLLAARRAGVPEPRVDATCPDCGRSHGRPRLLDRSGVRLSLTHAGSFAFAVAATTPVGIDAEPLGTAPDRAQAAAGLLGPGERRWLAHGDALRRWTAAEAVLKADGRGLRVDPGEVRLGPRRAELDGIVYRLRSFRRRGCRVTVAQALSEGSRRSLSQASKNALSGSPA